MDIPRTVTCATATTTASCASESGPQGEARRRFPVAPGTLDYGMRQASGRHFLQIPGPTNVPDRVLRAMAAPTIDHRGPAFRDLTREVLRGLAAVIRTRQPVLLFPASEPAPGRPRS